MGPLENILVILPCLSGCYKGPGSPVHQACSPRAVTVAAAEPTHKCLACTLIYCSLDVKHPGIQLKVSSTSQQTGIASTNHL